MGLHEQIKELQRKAGSYDLLKEEYDKLKHSIMEVSNKLKELSGSSGSNYGFAKKHRNILYEKLKIGEIEYITVDSVNKYLDGNGITGKYISNNILQKMKFMKNIKSRKENNKLVLFYHKTN